MRFVIPTDKLKAALAFCCGAVPNKSPRPEMLCTKLEVSGALVASAQCAEFAVRVTVSEIDTHTPGTLLLPAEKLKQMVDGFEEPTVAFEDQAGVTTIHGERSTMKLFGYEPAKWPTPVSIDEKIRATVKLPAPEMHGMLRQLLAVRTSDCSTGGKTFADGYLFEITKGRVRCFGTDGWHLIGVTRKGETYAGTDADSRATGIVPTKALKAFAEQLDPVRDKDLTACIAIANECVEFTVGNIAVTAVVVEGVYPPLDEVLKQPRPHHIVVTASELRAAIEKAAIYKDEHGAVMLTFNATEGRIIVSSDTPVGGVTVTLDPRNTSRKEPLVLDYSDKWPEGEHSLCVRVSRIAPVLAACPGTVTLTFSKASSPIGLKDEGFQYGVSPSLKTPVEAPAPTKNAREPEVVGV